MADYKEFTHLENGNNVSMSMNKEINIFLLELTNNVYSRQKSGINVYRIHSIRNKLHLLDHIPAINYLSACTHKKSK